MLNKKWIFSFIFLGLNVFSAELSALPQPLHGAWYSKCEKHNETQHYKMTSIEIHEDIWTQTIWWANDARCENMLLEQQSMYSFFIQRQIWKAKTLMSYIRPYVQPLADKFNQQKLCGKTNWKHGRVIEVTGLICEDFLIPQYNQLFNANIRIEGPKNNLLLLNEELYLLDPSSF